MFQLNKDGSLQSIVTTKPRISMVDVALVY